MTVLENITMAPRQVLDVSAAEAEKRARMYLDKVGLPNRSGGSNFRRFSPAANNNAWRLRALAMEPRRSSCSMSRLPHSTQNVGEVLKVIQTLAEEGRTMLMVTHEMGFARGVSSQVLFLHQGRVEGTAMRILDQPNSERLQQFLSSRLK